MSVDLSTIETQLVAVLGAITVDGAAIKVYDHEPMGLDRLPAITLFPPDVDRAAIDQPDIAPMGQYGWVLHWKLRIYVRLDNAKRAQDQLKAILGDVIRTVDLNQTANNSVFECRLVKATSGTINFNEGQPVMLYDCDLDAFYFTT